MEENAVSLEIILQDCLTKIRDGQETLDSALAHYPNIAADLRPLLEAALWIQSRQDALRPRPGFISDSRHRLVEQIQNEQAVRSTRQSTSWWSVALNTLSAGFHPNRRALQFVMALTLVLVILFTAGGTGIARASQSALPGDLLYRVKRTIEKAELALTPDEAGKARIYIENARSRLEEVRSLLAENRTDHIGETVSLFEDHVYNAISIMAAVREDDGQKAEELAGELNSTLHEETTALRNMGTSSSPQANVEIDRLLAVSDGMVVLVEDRFPLVAATPTEAPAAISTTEMAVVLPSVTTPVPQAPPSVPPKFDVIIPDPFEYTTTLTSTETITSTTTVSPGENKPSSDKQKGKPIKTPKTEKTKKDKPEHPEHPPHPNQ